MKNALDYAIKTGREEGKAEGEAKGEARGKTKGKLEIAKEMLVEKLPLSLIQNITGIDSVELEKLAKSL